MADHFFATFPQLEGVRFSHTWGGVIDTCSRFFPFFGTGFGGKVAYAVGYTGLGVGSTRFGAQVMLDLLSGEKTELTSLKTIRAKPVPFPPEPLRSTVINLTRWSAARADCPGRLPQSLAQVPRPVRPRVRLLGPSACSGEPRAVPSVRELAAGMAPPSDLVVLSQRVASGFLLRVDPSGWDELG